MLQSSIIQVGENQFEVPSHTDPHTTYTVLLGATASSCTCKGYGYRRTCSHIDEVRKWLSDILSQPIPPPTPDPRRYCNTCAKPLPATHVASGLCPSCLSYQTLHPTTIALQSQPPYPWCHTPKICHGSCYNDPSCGD
jgi:hypothetical protein